MRALAICLLIFIPAVSFSQKIKPQKIAKLPKQIDESSGLAIIDSNLWTINDNGILFLLDFQKNLYGNSLLGNSDQDCEDLSSDSEFLYIGDLGNNSNRRKDLTIYKIPKEELRKTAFFSLFRSISFSYPDQKQFPSFPSNWNFDCEAFFHNSDSLFLFSKNNSNPNDGFTKMYRLPDREGNFTVELIDSFYLNESVTSADISPDGKTMVLLTYFSLWLFKDFTANNFFAGKVFQFPFKGFTQKEGICFVNDHELFMTDERRLGKGGKLYRIDLNQLDFSQPTLKYKKQGFKRAIYNAFNNPKKRYKRIMEREAAQ